MTIEPDPSLIDIMALATEHHGAGRLAEAEYAYRQVLATDGNHAAALHGFGILMWQTGHPDVAFAALGRASAVARNVWRYHCTYGQFCCAVARYRDAVVAFVRTTVLQPDVVDAWLGLAGALHAQGKLNEAVPAYREALALVPDQVEARNDLGVALFALDQLREAIEEFRIGLEYHPQFVPLHNNLGNALLSQGLAAEAAAALQHALTLDGDSAELWFNYGNALAAVPAIADAIVAYRRALALAPDHGKAMVNLANALRTKGDLQAAVDQYHCAIALDPQFYDAYSNAGVALQAMGRIDDAIDMLTEAIDLRPEISFAHNNLGNAFKDAGRLDDAIDCYRRALALNPRDTRPHSNVVYTLSFHPAYDAWAILREAQAWAAAHVRLDTQPDQHLAHDRAQARRLRIAYVSADFRDHCQALFMMPLLANHDRSQFEIYCYAQVSKPDEVTARLAQYVDVWRSSCGQSDAQLAAQVRDDGIDILVDLAMHMSNGRPMLFAEKPAPVQIAWLAYPGTTGLPAIDYRLTDPWLDPDTDDDDRYSEASIRLPHTFWCYDPLDAELQVSTLPALAAGYVTFGCLNNFCKVSDETLRCWSRVLAKVEGSRLILLAASGAHRQRVLDVMADAGVAYQRIEFVEQQPRARYLATYHRIDICLDTLPYNGHTTSLDAFWMGVPVVTQLGQTVVGRAGWSQLNNLGMPELAAKGELAFIDIALALVADFEKLDTLRQGLRKRMQASPLMDAKGFAAALEGVYREVWRHWCEGADTRASDRDGDA